MPKMRRASFQSNKYKGKQKKAIYILFCPFQGMEKTTKEKEKQDNLSNFINNLT